MRNLHLISSMHFDQLNQFWSYMINCVLRYCISLIPLHYYTWKWLRPRIYAVTLHVGTLMKTSAQYQLIGGMLLFKTKFSNIQFWIIKIIICAKLNCYLCNWLSWYTSTSTSCSCEKLVSVLNNEYTKFFGRVCTEAVLDR